MTFAEIEQIIGAKLPRSARYRAWWSNNDFNNVMTKAWLEAGFRSEQVDVPGRKLVFRREREPHAPEVPGNRPLRHPLLGALKGLVRLAPGADLTMPAEPTWGAES
jgi:hypothetical protein